jgi:hypothetical protein
VDVTHLRSVVDRVGYLPVSVGRPRYRIYPPSSGRPPERPPTEYHELPFYDCRPVVDRLELDRDGVELRRGSPATEHHYDDEFVREHYYPEVELLVKAATGAAVVLAFDHNVRSADGVRREQVGAQPPVDAAHGDYTDRSGLRRVQQVLAERGEPDSGLVRAAIVNVWRPITELVQDRPLAVCDPRSASMSDFVETAIEHFGDDVSRPRHTGQIYSLRFKPEHQWLYVSDMRSDELLLFKAYDSVTDGRPRFIAHTAFTNPACPQEFVPRESIEVRTAVIY